MKALQHNTKIHTDIIIEEYSNYVSGYVDIGWDPYILTFMFRQIRGSGKSVHRQMERELERVYATMLTRMVRNPRSNGKVGNLPIWIACPDYPVAKCEKQSLREVTINDGLHVHAIALVPPETRLRHDLRAHVQAHYGLYVRGHQLQRIHVQPIETRPDYVTSYVLKALARRRVDFDDIIVLPRSRAEMGGRGA